MNAKGVDQLVPELKNHESRKEDNIDRIKDDDTTSSRLEKLPGGAFKSTRRVSIAVSVHGIRSYQKLLAYQLQT